MNEERNAKSWELDSFACTPFLTDNHGTYLVHDPSRLIIWLVQWHACIVSKLVGKHIVEMFAHLSTRTALKSKIKTSRIKNISYIQRNDFQNQAHKCG